MSSKPVISSIICTYNRGQVLGESLASFAAMSLPEDVAFELLVVDNNSSDDTASIANEFCARQPWARYVFEPTPGLSHARNRGIREARGEIVVFIDDDVYLDRNWAHAMLAAFANHPDASAVGGKIIPVFEAGRPEWLSDDLLVVYGHTPYGDSGRWLTYPELPIGANMAFRREVFESVGPFDPRLGRIGERLLSNEENDFFYRLNRRGRKVLYAPTPSYTTASPLREPHRSGSARATTGRAYRRLFSARSPRHSRAGNCLGKASARGFGK